MLTPLGAGKRTSVTVVPAAVWIACASNEPAKISATPKAASIQLRRIFASPDVGGWPDYAATDAAGQCLRLAVISSAKAG